MAETQPSDVFKVAVSLVGFAVEPTHASVVAYLIRYIATKDSRLTGSSDDLLAAQSPSKDSDKTYRDRKASKISALSEKNVSSLKTSSQLIHN